MNDATISVRVSKEVKTKAESVLKALNISMSGAIDLYLREIAFHRGLPFAVQIPNEVTLKAMHEVEQGAGLNKNDLTLRRQKVVKGILVSRLRLSKLLKSPNPEVRKKAQELNQKYNLRVQ